MRRALTGVVPRGILAVALLAGGASRDANGDGDANGSTDAALALDAVERHGALVAFRLRRAGDEDGDPAPGLGAAAELHRRMRRSLRVPAVLLRDRRTLIVADPLLPLEVIAGIDVSAGGKPPVAGRLVGFVPDLAAAIVETDADLAAESLPVREPTVGGVTAEPAWVGGVADDGDGPIAWVDRARDLHARRRRLGGGATTAGRPTGTASPFEVPDGGGPRSLLFLLAADGRPVAMRLGAAGDPVGLSALAAALARAVPIASIERRAASLRTDSFVHAVRLAFRPAARGDEALAASAPACDTEPDGDARWWGLAVAPDLLVVPAALPPTWIARIARVHVEETGGPALEARFEGRVKGLGAFAVRLVRDKVDALPSQTLPAPAAEHAFLVHRVAWRAGARRDFLWVDRSLGRRRGLNDRLVLAPEVRVETGAFLLDLDARVLGFVVERTVEPSTSGDAPPVAPVLFEDVGPPASLAGDLDRRVLPTSSPSARRLPWLGVEVEAVRSAAVAEALDVSGPTHEGARGLLVNVVHPDSPAARAGLAADDVLLSARRTGPGADPTRADLRGDAAESDWADMSDVPRPWAPRSNALVRLLETWGEGTAYSLEVLRDDAVIEFATVVEAGPADVTTARDAQDAETGLTVKELTYEVRHGLRLGKDAPGVLVAAVEDGSPAAQARVLRHELIVEIDGKPLDGPDAFTKTLLDARVAGRREVRAVVLRLDRTRFVDLRVGGLLPPSPSGR